MTETFAFICPWCSKPASASVEGVADWDGSNQNGEHVAPPVLYELCQCSECAQVSLFVREDFGGGFEDDPRGTVYPAPRRLSWDVPSPLRAEWDEARTCFDAKAYSACVVMVRRTIEGTCKDQGVNERTLAAMLRELRTKGLIEGMLADWADALRIAGNRGAHFTGEQVSREDAEDALAFAEALLDHLYVLRKRFDEFQQRLAARKSGSKV